MPEALSLFESVALRTWRRAFDDMPERLEVLARTEVSVGSAVRYARYIHDGARGQAPRPFLRIGFERAASLMARGRSIAGIPSIYSDRDRLWSYLTGGVTQPRDSRGRFIRRLTARQLIEELGESVRIESQRAVAELGAYDTGFLLTSIAWGHTEREMLDKSRRAARGRSSEHLV